MSAPSMERPLLVSDLDGTLLDSEKRVSERTVAVVNQFVARGGLFSVATARMPYGFRSRLERLDLRIPTVVMNGAALYSLTETRFEHTFAMTADDVAHVAAVTTDVGAGAFVYAVDDGRLRIGHASRDDLRWTQYNSEAAQAAHGPFAELGSSGWSRLGDVIYVAVVGGDDVLAAASAALGTAPGIRCLPYRNVYTETDCLEVAAAGAGKENALAELVQIVGADGLVAFGDNYNDVGMMEMADVSFAPDNAVPSVRDLADEVIPSNDDDGVATAVQQHFLD